MLIGEYGYSIDIKGRLNFPAKLREDLGDRFMIAKGLGDHCLAVYSMAEWEEKTAKIKTYPTAKAKELQRFLFPSAFEAEPDKQGRIVIPQNLREYAGLEKDVMVVGTGDRCEIWSKDEWERISGSISAESISELVDILGF
ncbi:MAG: division/cell wall cluster transcriptional repressor MraZ [Candidatus Merdivicinus sp.]